MKRIGSLFVNVWKKMISNKKLKVHVIKSIIVNYRQSVTVMEML